MDNYVVATGVAVTEDELRAFVEARGGEWTGDERLASGTISRDHAVVFLFEEQQPGYGIEELRVLSALLGCSPKYYISIHLGHEPESQSLAAEVAKGLADMFCGVVDDNSGVLFE